MFHEYAVDPAVLCSWERVRYFLDAFGPWKGRFLARYPRRWKKMVYASLACADLEKKRIVERLHQLDRRVFSPRVDGPFDPALPWLENAEREHDRDPFWAIIARRATGRPHVLDATVIDELTPRWAAPTDALLPRTAPALWGALDLLIRSSSHLLWIDPYFRADRDRFTELLATLGATYRPDGLTVSIHAKAIGHVPYSIAVSDSADRLPRLLPRDFAITIHWWNERPQGERLHNRYLLTDVGGVAFGDSIEIGPAGQHDHLTILNDETRARIWSWFEGESPRFDPAGDPLRVIGRAGPLGPGKR